MNLPVVLVRPSATGGLEAAAMPAAQGSRFRTVRPEPGYIRTAAEAAARALRTLGVSIAPQYGGIRLHFLEPLDAPTDGRPVIGYAGFFSSQTPDTIYIVAPWVREEALPWMVAHEIAHAYYYDQLGLDGSAGPHEAGPSELFADRFADRLAGPCPLAGRSHVAIAPAELDDRKIAGILPAITVENPSGTVVIDGTSNMFKIAATGTMSKTIGDSSTGWSDTTLTGLGAQSSTPAHVSHVSTNNVNTGERVIGAQYVNWVPVPEHGDIIAPKAYMDVSTLLNGSNVAVVRFGGLNETGASITWHCRYYVLKEAAI